MSSGRIYLAETNQGEDKLRVEAIKPYPEGFESSLRQLGREVLKDAIMGNDSYLIDADAADTLIEMHPEIIDVRSRASTSPIGKD
jgi:hypothetical protein